jgi:hypothetical protein
MILSNEEKKYTLNEYLRNISHLQDREYQEKIWIRGEGPECQAFDDAVCDFFDIGDPILESYKDFGITKAQYELLNNLRNAFNVFTKTNDFPQEFIDTPEWEKIATMAKDILKAFDDKTV